jgi:hypothetical protein
MNELQICNFFCADPQKKDSSTNEVVYVAVPIDVTLTITHALISTRNTYVDQLICILTENDLKEFNEASTICLNAIDHSPSER